jgi:adenosylmethionine-8-amino-7-oxononanoate aminotransferase
MHLSARQEKLLKLTFIDFSQMDDFVKAPLILNKAEGLYYWDADGHRYFDAIGGIFVAVLGHCHPRVMEAMRKQMEQMTFTPPLHAISDIALDFVEKLGSITPGTLDYVKPFSGGSESTESALKFARQYHRQTGNPGKHKFVSFYTAYHGSTFGAMAASGTGKRKTKFEPQMPGVIKAFPPHLYRDMFPSPEAACQHAARMVEDLIIHEDPETVAGLLVEPISNTGGIATPPPEYFSLLRQICDRHNVTLIFDEVITGFARTGQMFAAQTIGTTPDIICAGKGLSSGALPLGAMMARADMGQAFLGPNQAEVQFAHGHTFAGNPLGAAVGMAVIDEILEKKLCDKARTLGDYLAHKLEGLKQFGVVREVRGRGMLRGVELVKDTTRNEPFDALGLALKKTALANGLIMRINPNWFAVAPALIAERADIDELYGLIETSLREALATVKP